jgi:DNA-binding transcriptional ArsR family regulator
MPQNDAPLDAADDAQEWRAAGRALGIPDTRLAVIQLASCSDEVTAGELMRELRMTRNGVGRHLEALTRDGLLIERRATHPRGSGWITYWSLDADALRSALDALREGVVES